MKYLTLNLNLNLAKFHFEKAVNTIYLTTESTERHILFRLYLTITIIHTNIYQYSYLLIFKIDPKTLKNEFLNLTSLPLLNLSDLLVLDDLQFFFINYRL